MTRERPPPTPQQRVVICHDGSAFIRACPGAGKTYVMAERAQKLLERAAHGCGIAFLSFTQAAVFELDLRLREIGTLRSPVFPNFVGTFDSFVWNFLVAPFGIDGSDARPRLVPDIPKLVVRPYDNAQDLTLSCFKATGEIEPAAAKRQGFDVSQRSPGLTRAYETTAANIRRGLRDQGYVGFEEARSEALSRLGDTDLSGRLAAALAGRFDEVIVDEAQDCNPQDLKIVDWLRSTGIPVKVVCDPDQAIYSFRGGVTDHLAAFEKTFPCAERLELRGNFRSSPNICKVIAQLRPVDSRNNSDEPTGRLAEDDTPIHVLAYPGTSVPVSIGEKLSGLLRELHIDASDCPVVAATKASAAAAVGQPQPGESQHRALRLAESSNGFYSASDLNGRRVALERTHELFLEVEDRLIGTSYWEYVCDRELKPDDWRPRVMEILGELRYDPQKHSDARAWHAAAKQVLSQRLNLPAGRSVSQRLPWTKGIEGALFVPSRDAAVARTIHSVKGLEFRAMCVITTSPKLTVILDFLETGSRPEVAEEARKLYVGASRAKQLLVVAAPKSQASRLAAHLRGYGAHVLESTV